MRNSIQLPIPFDYEVYEYLLLIGPSKKIKKEIMRIKGTFYHDYNHIQAIKSKPHITLAHFDMYNSMEKALIIRINEVVNSCEPFQVIFNGINYFEPHTIFIDVVDQEPINHLVKSLQQRMLLPRGSSFFSKRPHMTIASGLDQDKFQEGMIGLAELEYTDSFLVDKIILMKRKKSFMKYELVREFKLGLNNRVAA